MYNNIGDKIKKLAFLSACAGTIISIIIGSILINSVHEYSAISTPVSIYGYIVIVCGIFGSWAVYLILYGFGELIDRAISIDSKLPNSTNSKAALEQVISGAKANDEEKTASTPSEEITQLKYLYDKGFISKKEYIKRLKRLCK